VDIEAVLKARFIALPSASPGTYGLTSSAGTKLNDKGREPRQRDPEYTLFEKQSHPVQSGRVGQQGLSLQCAYCVALRLFFLDHLSTI